MSQGMDRRNFMKGISAGIALTAASTSILASGKPSKAKEIKVDSKKPLIPQGSPVLLPPLLYPENGLAPYISERTVKLHYEKHHASYIELLRDQIKGSAFDGLTLEEIIRQSHGGINKVESINQIAILSWNHNFYWKSMKPNGGGQPSKKMAEIITGSLGSYDAFRKKFLELANDIGSGWVWVVADGSKKIDIIRTTYHDNPIIQNQVPLLVLDVWEHAYYIDYENRKVDYVNAWLDHLVNWEFAEKGLAV